MFENKNMIWGAQCDNCEREVYILQDKYHPWNITDKTYTIICSHCGRINIINQKQASEFYTGKIFKIYENIEGSIIDVGCGGGLLANELLKNKNNSVFAIDKDETCRDELSKEVNFILDDVKNIKKHFSKNQVDYIIGRDILMFIEDIEQFILDCYEIVKKGITFVGWYNLNNSRMINKVNPHNFSNLIPKKYVTLEELDWYKNGYILTIKKSG